MTMCKRTRRGIGAWPLGWLCREGTEGVVCFERAKGRIDKEHGGTPNEKIVKAVVKRDELLTLTANPSDHYVVLSPKAGPRFMTVQEVARAFAVPDDPKGKTFIAHMKEDEVEAL